MTEPIPAPEPDIRPATPRTGLGAWLRANLFRSPVDAVVTVVAGTVAVLVLWRTARFVLVTGRWDVVRDNLQQFLVGRYPTVHLPRVAISVVVMTLVAGLAAGCVHRRQVAAGTSPRADMTLAQRLRDLLARFWPLVLGAALLLGLSSGPGPWTVALGVVAAAAVGRLAGARLPTRSHPVVLVAVLVTPFALVAYLADAVGWDLWGGLMLNVFIAVAAIVASFPVGVLAALGRRSSLPVVRLLSTVYIEALRGAPLFVLLLMAHVALGFFVPTDSAPGPVMRAMIVFTLFTGAYLAEIVRGGLQSLPAGQAEAGKALGLSPTRITFLIVLPQALRNVIPAQVGQFISLFKDTTLAGAAMSLFEVLEVGRTVTAQGPFAGQALLPESFAFVGLLFWVGSFTMSRESQRIERRLGVGQR